MSNTTWSCEHTTETTATAARVWSIFTDVASWPRWNAGVERIDLDAPFETGSSFLMTMPGQPPISSTLIDVRARDRFVDETIVGDLAIVVSHRIEPAAGGRSKIVYTLTATGPGCDEIGPAIASDFPDVLAALKGFAEQPS